MAANCPGGVVEYRCNICGGKNAAPLEELGRENASCADCKSTVRMRAVVHLLSKGLFSRSLVLSGFPVRTDIKGVGLSDWVGYASGLASCLGYTNTFYHEEPRLDITDIGDDIAGSCDFLISTDVFEHVLPPISRAFAGAKRLLRPGGLLVLTVPFMTECDETAEHFPDLHEFVFEDLTGGRRRLRNRKKDDTYEVFDDLIFHGGPGSTLEMRVFAKKALEDELHRAGFKDIRFENEPFLEYGIYWRDPWSIPITARA